MHQKEPNLKRSRRKIVLPTIRWKPAPNIGEEKVKNKAKLWTKKLLGEERFKLGKKISWEFCRRLWTLAICG